MCGGAKLRREDFCGVTVCRAVDNRGISVERGSKRYHAATHAFAPKLKKNWSSAKHTMNGTVPNVWNFPARIPTAW